MPAAAKRPLIVPVFLPQAGCPHRCAFCNQNAITGIAAFPDPASIQAAITSGLRFRSRKRAATQIAFYGGNFLGLAVERIRRLLDLATIFVDQGLVDGIRFSTRPDTIDAARLDLLAGYPVAAIEIGVQSMHAAVLRACRRGHTPEDSRRAARRIKARGYLLGVQMMVGLPDDTAQRSFASGLEIAAMEPDFVRIYPTLVFRGSRLAKWFETGAYTPLGLEAAVRQVKHLCLLFGRQNIPVIRMGLQASAQLDARTDLVAGPYHPAFGHLVWEEIFLDMVRHVLASGKIPETDIELRVHPRSVSRLRGYKNRNTQTIMRAIAPGNLTMLPDESLDTEAVVVNGQYCRPADLDILSERSSGPQMPFLKNCSESV